MRANRTLLLIGLAAALASACWHVGASSTDAGSMDSDGDTDTESDSAVDTDTDPFNDYDCDDIDDSMSCEMIICAAQDQYKSALENCAEGEEYWCQIAEECLLPYGICIDEACTVPTNPDLDDLSACVDTLIDCEMNIAS
jgi:hypothetical protein